MRDITIPSLRASAALCLLALAGCDSIDPLTRPYAWNPTNINAHNIAAMAANPADLRHGRDRPKRLVGMDSDAADRVLTGHALPLLSGGGSSGGGGGGGGGAASPGGGS